ncbi:unnamed protein product [Prunus armeniaca]|uniref:Uncharacterized protein n=1 Tax=Prunus armeniaca TaxID=36596 RepID=A0A6J5X9X8_PRUAR|nr:unnamed protein product [Prunus armeniaca]
MDDCYDVVAFHETRKGKEWNKVNVDSCDAPFQERAVVVDKSIYVISMPQEEEIVAFSFEMIESDGGDIEYSLIKQFVLCGMQIEQPPFAFCRVKKQFLIHLGNQDFFHVKIGPCDSNGQLQLLVFPLDNLKYIASSYIKSTMKTINLMHDFDCFQQ